MLSKVVTGEKVEKLELKPYDSPSLDELDMMIADKLREAQRMKIIEDNKDDPIKAAQKEANRILIEAQEKLKAAELESEVLKNRKERELRVHLEKEFQAKFEQKVNQIQQTYMMTVEELVRLKETLYQKSEKQMMDMVFSITRKITETEIKTSPDVILNMLKKVFERVKGAKECEIKINPQDFEVLAKRKDSLGEIIKSGGQVKLTKDEHIERGGCHIITEMGEISSEPGKQLDIIIRELSDGA